MAKKSDAVTRWWRGISLRAKVTGVTVAVLAIGLVAAGIGTGVFLRTALLQNLGTQLDQLQQTNVASGLFIAVTGTDGLSFEVNPKATQTDYYVALYGPAEGMDGKFLISGGGDSASPPVFPDEFTLLQTQQTDEAFMLPSEDGHAQFLATVSNVQFSGSATVYTQLIALPIAPVNRVVTTFLGIFGIIGLLTLIAAALLTRWAVTLAFRSLGQVEATAMSIAAGDFTQRMTDIEPRTEVGKLKLAINTMLNRVDGALAQRDGTLRQMRRFIGDASHELRTPLVSVRGYAELYRMGAIRGDDDTAQAMDRIEKEAIRMGELVEDLLSLARLDERRDVVIAPVDLRPVARDAALDLRAAAPQRVVSVVDTTVPTAAPAPRADADEPDEPDSEPARRRSTAQASPLARAGATLSLLRRKPRPVPAARATTAADAGAALPSVSPIHLAPVTAPIAVATPPIVLGDENRVRQVVANLVANARRYTPDDSPVELVVGVDSTAGMGWIAIADHGDGIPDQIKEQIFQRFWRADTSRARETGGSGLGLSIVASIVDALHGAVVVADTPGGGATFRVSFPLAAARDAAEHLLIETQPLPRLAFDDEG